MNCIKSAINLSLRQVCNRKLSSIANLSLVPQYRPHTNFELQELSTFIENSWRLLVISGAGISTESGIPDYRSELTGLIARKNYRPMMHQTFMASEEARQRYWARNYVAWNRFSSFEPNVTHRYLKHLEEKGKIGLIVTQNVDHLHHKAGSRKVLELHGSSYEVVCMNCGNLICRKALQSKIAAQNEPIRFEMDRIEQRPDGDVDLPTEFVERFQTPVCDNCNGILKPKIVFFGDAVPLATVNEVRQELPQSDGLLVLGTSLHVNSAYRYVVEAYELRKPIWILNIGQTRADHLATVKISSRCGAIFKQLLQN